MRDRWWQRGVKRVARARYAADLALTRAWRRARSRPRYELVGACQECGECCRNPRIRPGPLQFHLRTLRWLLVTWHRAVNGFELVEVDRRTRSLVFRCTHWDPATRRCDSYDSRPGLCRDYPANLVDSPAPEFFAGCGHRALDRHAAGFRAALEGLDLPPETLEALRGQLHLVEDPRTGGAG